MQVQVEYRLPGVGPGIRDDAVAGFGKPPFARQLSGHLEHAAQEEMIAGREVVQVGHVAPGDQEKMDRGLRLDVLEGDDLVVGEDGPGRNRSGGNPTEEAFFHARTVAPRRGSSPTHFDAGAIWYHRWPSAGSSNHHGRNSSAMTRPRMTRVLAALGAIVLVAVGCQQTPKQSTGDQVSKQDLDQIAKILADTAGGMNKMATPAPTLPANIVFTRDDIPREGGYLQVTIGDVTDGESNLFLRRLKTERCTCGCPHTIDQCLIEDPQCDVAHRLAAQVLREVQLGS